ncbi:hypothetical protein BDU57DRAFT_508352 [Ampelomyces quisqualis]|uniref:Uncharacterized protein n=1 Tax=Ampelomyces quisqualis TaxID=50730 RepID=A0A6A5R257_AMPQU|nr:hypothetical protein BDU57DRAFT_508352 [Ampelomyces quisqualis]
MEDSNHQHQVPSTFPLNSPPRTTAALLHRPSAMASDRQSADYTGRHHHRNGRRGRSGYNVYGYYGPRSIPNSRPNASPPSDPPAFYSAPTTHTMSEATGKKPSTKSKEPVFERHAATAKKAGTLMPLTPQSATATAGDPMASAPASATTHACVPKYTPKTAHLDRDSQTSTHQYVPGEGQTQPMDATHPNPANTVSRLDHETIMQLQIFNITLAAKLKENLKQAKTKYEAEQAVHAKKRDVVHSLLQLSLQAERGHDTVVRHMYDRFHHHMTDACARDGEAKSAAQLRATTQLKSAAEVSRLAAAERAKIDKYRNDLHDLDNARAISQNVYSDTVHDVLMAALGSKKLEAHVAKAGKSTDKAAPAFGNVTNPPKGRQDSGAVTSPYTHQEGTQQGVIENLPEVERPSISEVLSRVNIIQAGEDPDAPPKAKEQRTMASVVNRPVGPEVVQKAIDLTLDAPTMHSTGNMADLKKPQAQNDQGKDLKKKGAKGKEHAADVNDNQNKIENKLENKPPAKPTTMAHVAEKPREGSVPKAQPDKPGHESTGRKKNKKNNNNKKKGGGDGTAAADGKGNAQVDGGAPESSSAAGAPRKGG